MTCTRPFDCRLFSFSESVSIQTSTCDADWLMLSLSSVRLAMLIDSSSYSWLSCKLLTWVWLSLCDCSTLTWVLPVAAWEICTSLREAMSVSSTFSLVWIILITYSTYSSLKSGWLMSLKFCVDRLWNVIEPYKFSVNGFESLGSFSGFRATTDDVGLRFISISSSLAYFSRLFLFLYRHKVTVMIQDESRTRATVSIMDICDIVNLKITYPNY